VCTRGPGVHSLVSRMLVMQPHGGAAPVQGALLLHNSWCLWSSLGARDTAALCALAAAALLPAVQAATQPSFGMRITSTLGSAPVAPMQLHAAPAGLHNLCNHSLMQHFMMPADGPGIVLWSRCFLCCVIWEESSVDRVSERRSLLKGSAGRSAMRLAIVLWAVALSLGVCEWVQVAGQRQQRAARAGSESLAAAALRLPHAALGRRRHCRSRAAGPCRPAAVLAAGALLFATLEGQWPTLRLSTCMHIMNQSCRRYCYHL
jgi:hypothetical protein